MPNLLSLVVYEREGVLEVATAGELLATNLVPLGANGGEAGVALHLYANVGDVEFAGQGHRLAVNLAATNDEDLLLAIAHRQRLLQRPGHLATLDTEVCIAGNYDVATIWQWSADAFVGLASHYHGVTRSHGLEVAKILGYVPGHSATGADNAVLGHGHDE